MQVGTWALVALAVMLLMACGGAAAPAPQPLETLEPTTTSEVTLKTGHTAMGIGRELEGVEITIDQCAWTKPEGGGDPEISVSFMLNNRSGEQIFTTYRLQNSSGTFYKKAGVGGDLTVNDGESGARTLTTDKFEVGSEDIDLIVSIERFQDRTHQTIPLGECTPP